MHRIQELRSSYERFSDVSERNKWKPTNVWKYWFNRKRTRYWYAYVIEGDSDHISYKGWSEVYIQWLLYYNLSVKGTSIYSCLFRVSWLFCGGNFKNYKVDIFLLMQEMKKNGKALGGLYAIKKKLLSHFYKSNHLQYKTLNDNKTLSSASCKLQFSFQLWSPSIRVSKQDIGSLI